MHFEVGQGLGDDRRLVLSGLLLRRELLAELFFLRFGGLLPDLRSFVLFLGTQAFGGIPGVRHGDLVLRLQSAFAVGVLAGAPQFGVGILDAHLA